MTKPEPPPSKECGLITSGTDKASNWLLRESNMDKFCKTILRAAWKHPKPDGVTYKVRIEILNGEEDPYPPDKESMTQPEKKEPASNEQERVDING